MDIRKKLFTKKLGGEALDQVAQGGGGRPILGDTQAQAGWGSDHPRCPCSLQGVRLGDF